MKSAKAVIGAGFGDEGKGLMTDYLASKSNNAIVVRYNGGAQAGHTVVTPEGYRHVFSHFGSGSLMSHPTYLPEFFIVNPMMWADERSVLKQHFDMTPHVFVHPDAFVTTPYDMLLNQFLEEHRGAVRHGSCGMGINETVVRSSVMKIDAKFLGMPIAMSKRLGMIRDVWVPMRMKTLGIPMTEERMFLIRSNDMWTQFLESAELFVDKASLASEECLELRDVIFEGAQGLLLDEGHRFFPHVTRSRTGLNNILHISKNAGIEEVEVNYMIRSYMTRHGAGPFPTYDEYLSYEDHTNNPNPWQGSLRFGFLDLDLVGEAVRNDYRDFKNVKKRLVVTHMDQVQSLDVRIGGQDIHNLKLEDFLDHCRAATGIANIALASGPTRNDITRID